MTEQHLHGPPSGAIPLSDAMQRFLPAEMWEEYDRAIEERQNLPMRPNFFSTQMHDWEEEKSAYKSKAQTRSAKADPNQVWADMVAAIKAKLEAGELTGFAQDDPPFGPWRAIPASAWRALRIKNVARGQATNGTVTLNDIHILPHGPADNLRTGVPGRPSKGIEIIRAEFERRVTAGEIAASLAAESRELADWYSQTYPESPRPTPKTIENILRSDYRAAKIKLI